MASHFFINRIRCALFLPWGLWHRGAWLLGMVSTTSGSCSKTSFGASFFSAGCIRGPPRMSSASCKVSHISHTVLSVTVRLANNIQISPRRGSYWLSPMSLSFSNLWNRWQHQQLTFLCQKCPNFTLRHPSPEFLEWRSPRKNYICFFLIEFAG